MASRERLPCARDAGEVGCSPLAALACSEPVRRRSGGLSSTTVAAVADGPGYGSTKALPLRSGDVRVGHYSYAPRVTDLDAGSGRGRSERVTDPGRSR